jgi:FAD/FMN-containing dehydrogenase
MIDQMIAPTSIIDPLALDLLRAALPGRVYTPGSSAYEAARAGYGLTDLPSPDVVVVAASAADVVAAVNFARTQQLPVGVHATGHNFGSPFKGGLRINTSRMQGCSIDPVAQTARIQAGVIWKSVVQAAHQYGLAPLNGSSPNVGVVGYSLFGGFGWLLRKYGAAVDSVIAADVVTADGQLRRVSTSSHPDLFWALRGASGNFGIVTALEFKLYPVSEVYGGALFFPMERAEEVLTTYSQWVAALPDEMTSTIVLMRVPPLPEVPEPLCGKAVVTVRAAYTGTEEQGVRLLQPLRDLGGLLADTFQMLPYSEIGTIANDSAKPVSAWRKTAMLNDLSPATIQTILQMDGVTGQAPVMAFEIRHLGGAMTRVQAASTAFSQRYAPFIMHTIGILMNPEQAEVVKRNTQAIFTAMRPHSTGGVLPSWLGDGDHGVERTRAGFSPEHYERLVALKNRFDPTNMFRQNHNIPPSKAITKENML